MKVTAALVGSAFCIVEDKYLLTANHLFSGENPRDANDRFYAFVVPDNGPTAYHFPIAAFVLEDAAHDLAVVEIGACSRPDVHIRALPVTFAPQPDGARVVTVGFPAPEIAALNVDADGNYHGGKFFLKSHANEGMVSAQYHLDGVPVYELNVGWHHGESGGPIVRIEGPLAAFSIMQHYRNVKSPHGVVAGPHRGLALSVIQGHLQKIGAAIV